MAGRFQTGAPAPGSQRAAAKLAAAILALSVALVLGACGSSSSSSSSSGASSSSSSSASASSSSSSSSSGPAASGESAKTVTLGTKDFTEEFIIGQLYRQALEAKGYTVNYKENIGATEIVDKALTSGQIDAYPEYTGESVATVAKINKTVSSPEQEYGLAKAFYAKRGQTMSQMTPFFDRDAIGMLTSYAKKHGLKTMTDLKKVSHFTLGARPEFLNRQEGAAGMKSVYGIKNFTFKSLALGVQYQALDSGSVDAADVFSTDAQLATGKYTQLSDPKNVFGFQNVALIISAKKLKELGGNKFMSIINKVNSLLTVPAITALNKAVALDKQPQSSVAHAFLKANGLVKS